MASAVKSAAEAAGEALSGLASAVAGLDPYGLDDLGMAVTVVAEDFAYALERVAQRAAGTILAPAVVSDFEDLAGYARFIASEAGAKLDTPMIMGRRPARQGWLGRRRYKQRDH